MYVHGVFSSQHVPKNRDRDHPSLEYPPQPRAQNERASQEPSGSFRT